MNIEARRAALELALGRVADGEKITFCLTQADVDFCIAELMTQRLAR